MSNIGRLTKEEISDLKSHVDRVRETSLNLQSAQIAHSQAVSNYESFLWKLEHEQRSESGK